MNIPPFVDLVSLVDSLGQTTKHKHLRDALRQAWRAQSCLGDLKQSADCCDILRGVFGRRDGLDSMSMTTQRALLTTAVMLYARATSTSGKLGERGSVQLEQGKLTAEQKANHQAILDVRNHALAHVYPDRSVAARTWHTVSMFAVELVPGRWKTASVTNQTAFHTDTANRLDQMLPVARELIRAKFLKRMGAVEKAISEAGLDRAEMLKHELDPMQLFGSKRSVEALLATAGDDEAAFWSNA